MATRGLLGLGLAAITGIVVGLGGFTFLYGRGYSYLLDDPRACVNCHIMRDQFDTWTVSTHRTVTCNQCHVPGAFPAKYLSKAANGFLHSYAFTFRDVQGIRIRSSNQHTLESNCQECHARLVAEIRPHGVRGTKFCFECHRAAGQSL